jgi:hypothetical protein
MKTKFPYYLIPVHSTDEYACYEPTHCAIQVRPSLILLIAWYSILARLVKYLSGEQPDIRFSFPTAAWVTLYNDENIIDETVFNEGGPINEDQTDILLDEYKGSLQSYGIQIYDLNFFCFLCNEKYSGAFFFSETTSLSKLFKALRFEHVLAEIEYFVLRLKAKYFFLRKKAT